jgi:hypothetical protein
VAVEAGWVVEVLEVSAQMLLVKLLVEGLPLNQL